MTKIAKWMRQPQSVIVDSHLTYMNVANLLEVEARFYNKVGNRDGARALFKSAAAMRQIGGNAAAPDAAFGWPGAAP